MIDSIKTGTVYSFRYKTKWADYDVFNLKVVSVTNEEGSKAFTKDSLYSEFFARYGVSLSDYVRIMDANPDVYVCNEVKSFDPKEIDDANFVIIPKAIIDFNNTIEYFDCDSYDIIITDVKKFSELAYDRGLFEKNIIENLKKSLRTVREIGDANTDVYIEATDILMSKTEYSDYDSTRNTSFLENEKAVNLALLAEDERIKGILLKESALDKLIDERNILNATIKLKETEVIEKLGLLDTSISNINSGLADIESLFNKLEDSQNPIAVGGSEYIALKASIITMINNLVVPNVP